MRSVGFVPDKVLVSGEGTAGVAPVKTFKKLSQIQAGPS